jgi:hypothetical protein
LLIVTTTSPFPPGYNRLLAAGDATAVIVRFETVPDCPSALEPVFSWIIQFVAAKIPPPASKAPTTTAREARSPT